MNELHVYSYGWEKTKTCRFLYKASIEMCCQNICNDGSSLRNDKYCYFNDLTFTQLNCFV